MKFPYNYTIRNYPQFFLIQGNIYNYHFFPRSLPERITVELNKEVDINLNVSINFM